IQVAERFADGLTTAGELFQAEDAIGRAEQSGELGVDGLGLACAYCCYRADDGLYPSGIAQEVANQMLVALQITFDEGYEAECEGLSNSLRCLFGNPFRSVAMNPSWLIWHDGLLASIAQRIYDNRDFTDMPVLADALEEAGCTNQDILVHCRSG